MQFDIVTIGSATVDHFADTDSELIRIDTRQHHEELIAFQLGSKLLIKELKTTVGGGGTNTAVAFSRLGLKTGYLGKIGEDAAGDFVTDLLKKENIEFVGARGGQTGFSVILNSIKDDRSILAYKGANDHLSTAEIPKLDTPWIYLSSMLEESWTSVVNLIANSDFKVAFNPSNYQAELGYEALSKLVDHVHILIVNREEACKFLGKNYHEKNDIHDLLKSLYALAPKIVVITDGSDGAFVYDGTTIYQGFPSPDLNILETTGAGDAFAATFTGAIIKGKDIKTALSYAMTNAESVLQYKGAKEKLLKWDDLVSLDKSKQRHIEIHQE
jgi:ribokinase